MVNKFSLLFCLRTDSVVDKEYPSITIRVTLNGTRLKLGSTGIRVKRSDWDHRSQRTKKRDVSSRADNELLDQIESQLRSIFLLFESERRLLTPIELKKRFRPNDEYQASTIKLMETYLAESADFLKVGQIAAKTHETRRDKLAVFRRFLEAEKKTDLLVSEIRGSILERFKNSMLKNGSKLSYAQKCQQFVKTFVRWAHRNGHIDQDPTASYPVKVDKTPILEHLSEIELKRLITTKFPKRLQETVDCYLFACYTGLAYIDMKQLSAASIVETEGRKYLSGNREKTDTAYFVPLATTALDIISKYGGIEKLPLRSNKEVNAMLKVAMAQAGIDRRIWFHTARKTFAHRMQNVLQVSDETTAAMIGHKSTKELKYYRSITRERVLKEVHDLDF